MRQTFAHHFHQATIQPPGGQLKIDEDQSSTMDPLWRVFMVTARKLVARLR
jgi:hypothetical protein